MYKRKARRMAVWNLRTFLAGIGLLIFCFAGCVPPSLAEDWPQFLGPLRNGVSADNGLVAAWPREGPPLLWEKRVGAGFSGAVIAGPRLILFHRVGDQELVECLDSRTGKDFWKFQYATGYR